MAENLRRVIWLGILALGALTSPVWFPVMVLWFALQLTYKAIQDLTFRIRYREEFAKMPKGPPEPRYCMRIDCADGTEMHFQLTKPPKRAWVRASNGKEGQNYVPDN